MPDLVPADTVDPATLHAAFTVAFADYVAGPFALGLSQWPHFLARQGVTLPLSRVRLSSDGRPRAFALVAERPQPRRWRLATMGAVPAARGQGDAPVLLQDLAARARAAGQCGLELEVFAQNPRAVRLYERQGFMRLADLHGHDAPPLGGTSAAPPPAMARADALAWLQAAEDDGLDLPLQLGARVLATADGWTAWQQGSALLVHGEGPDGRRLIRSLVDKSPTQADAETLSRALRAAYPAQAITMPPLLPDALGGRALQRAGFTRQPMHQWWMHCALP
ncbi:MAG: GNAT family N-acetyltransferase [Burkholderiaceae bacterium]|nr:GNAT family N-acetyltransferase [Burkholderiaceae bacterium]